jgi:hypothetical protein
VKIRHIQVSSVYEAHQNSVAYQDPLHEDWFYWGCRDGGMYGYWIRPDPKAKRFYLPVVPCTHEEARGLHDKWVAETTNENLVVVYASLCKVNFNGPGLGDPSRWTLIGALRSKSSLDDFDFGKEDTLPPWLT